ncbi:hypothetical protein N7495_004545 [Penicillium taxi]|uniref:uncharacterized protein n=1 Tax=Penicillium taxi TaxID=168475 RepID=UPI00254512CD|nr:uncharacterized protein N7495_004545 [Penicillium taxi]KAJ5899801.1 hypothetical protein N7495_004545 [Penicillium taxi]
MNVAETIKSLQPLNGKVVPIRTVQETQPPEDFGDAYIAEVNIKAASKVIKALDSAFPRDLSIPQTHLRRFAKREILPPPVRAAVEAAGSYSNGPGQTIFVLIPPPVPSIEELQALLAPFAAVTHGSITPSTTDIPSNTSSPDLSLPKVLLVSTRIPLQPPFNAQQAEKWSNTLWPIVFNPAAPRSTVAPPPQTLKTAQESIRPRAGYYLSLARKVAEESEKSGRGRSIGAVIVDPAIEAELEDEAWKLGNSSTYRWADAVIAVAGDARYGRSEAGAPPWQELLHGTVPDPAFVADMEGGPDLHALMRAIALVARRRREDTLNELETANLSNSTAATTDPQLIQTLSPLESHFLYEVDTLSNSVAPAIHANLPPLLPSPKKRKHEESSPESGDPKLGCSPSQPLSTLGPGPIPSKIATLAGSTISHLSNDKSTREEHASPSNIPIMSTIASVAPRIRTRSQGGYLCTDLDVYISHEPCLCCSMGMLLSRFRAVVFPRAGRMKTGGLASEPVVALDTDHEHEAHGDDQPGGQVSRSYYGLHWRKELNWRALGFEFVDGESDGNVETVDFNA